MEEEGFIYTKLVGGFNPSEKYHFFLDPSSPGYRGENKQCLKFHNLVMGSYYTSDFPKWVPEVDGGSLVIGSNGVMISPTFFQWSIFGV